MIKTINMSGIKNIKKKQIQDLSGFDIFMGGNGAGKSTRLESVMIAMQGYLSLDHGKTHDKTMELSNGDDMTVGINTDNGYFDRIFKRVNSKISQSGSVNGSPVKLGELNKAIDESLGSFPVMFNLGLFTSLPNEKKKDFLFTINGDVESFDDSDAFISKLLFGFYSAIGDDKTPYHILKYGYSVETIDELEESLHAEYFDKLADTLTEAQLGELNDLLDELVTKYDPKPSVLFDSVLMKTLSAEATYLRKVSKDAEVTKRKLAENASGMSEKYSDVREIEALIVALEESKSAKNIQIGKNGAQIERVKEYHGRMNELQAKITDAEEYIANADIEFLFDTVEHLKAELATVRDKMAEKKAELEVLDSKMLNITNKISPLEDSATTTEGVIEKLGSLDGYCVIAPELKIECNQDMSRAIDALKNEVTATRSPIGRLRQELNALGSEHSKAYDLLALLDAEQTEIMQRLNSAIEKHSTANVAYIKQTSSIEANKLDFETLKKKKLAEPVDVDILQTELDIITTNLEKMKGDKLSMERGNAMMDSLRGSVEAAQSAGEKMDVVKAMIASVKSIRNEFMHSVSMPVVDTINDIMKHVDDTYNVVFDMADGFDIMVTHKGDEKNFSALSGGEKVVFAVAMIVAIVMTADPKLKVLCLECAELDMENMSALMDSIPKIAEALDNVMVAYPHVIETPTSWTRHLL